MKKSLFIFAAAALALTACTSEDDVVQSAAQQNTAKAVAFDVYLPQASQTTRSGRVNIMNNSTLQTTGFGVFGYQASGTPGTYSSSMTPSYMWNQQVNYNSTNTGWFYAPLKYWPNETAHDSQSTAAGMPTAPTGANIDKLSFFAYAPWVKGTPADGTVASVYTDVEAGAAVGITKLTANTGKLGDAAVSDPKIQYVVATDPNSSVDLLWGVAPVGGLSYTDVSGNPVTITEGMPMIDLVKPAVNTSMKFLFQHALARLGVKVVLAADQVSAGGNFDIANTKVTIGSITIAGNFGTAGVLNLNNTGVNKAKWEDITVADGSDGSHPVLTIDASHGLAAHLRDNGTHTAQQTVTGVTTTYSDAIQVSSIPGYSKEATTPAYSATTPYFANATLHETPTYANYNTFSKTASTTYLQQNTYNGSYTDITSTINTTYPNATVWSNIYTIADADIVNINTPALKSTHSAKTAYRLVGNTYYPTGLAPEQGDYVFVNDPATLAAHATSSNYWLANSNYFMIIPPAGETDADKTLTVTITYYVTTTDPNVVNGVVNTENVVQKAIQLPHLKNGSAYNLKLILGLTSVKLEAEVADWTTTNVEFNLPQNTAE